jgi:hypothetical protein
MTRAQLIWFALFLYLPYCFLQVSERNTLPLVFFHDSYPIQLSKGH